MTFQELLDGSQTRDCLATILRMMDYPVKTVGDRGAIINGSDGGRRDLPIQSVSLTFGDAGVILSLFSWSVPKTESDLRKEEL
jgi:hypothetical protein